MDVNSIGRIGSVIYSLFTLLCLCRLFHSYFFLRNIMDLKIWFHFMISLNAAFELVFFSQLYVNGRYDIIIIIIISI